MLLSQGFALRKKLIGSGPMDVHASTSWCVRFDNGSSRSEAALNLRVIALRRQVARQFLSPGRHARPAGDIADICTAASRRNPGRKTT